VTKSVILYTVLGIFAGILAIIHSAFFELKTPAPTENSFLQATAQKYINPPETLKPEQSETRPRGNWRSYTIQRGDNLSRIFSKFKIPPKVLQEILSGDELSSELTALFPGRNIELLVNGNGLLDQLRYHQDKIDTVEVRRTHFGYSITKSSKPLEKRTASAHGIIHSSLYNDAKVAGLSDKLVMEMANIFAWDIDFALEIRVGDEFTVFYEQFYLDDKPYRVGKILAAEFINRGKVHTAIRFIEDNGVAGYYTPDGETLRKAFLRTPVEFARISSHFNLRRRHPILNKIRAHKGTDYAAPSGTPIRATGKGQISFRGMKGGYGRVVIVQHGQQYSTLYAHMSRFGKPRKGSQIKQGQIIGYVGKSGLATGPHLHYEFRVNGVHRNPLTVKLPNSIPIDQASMPRFRKDTPTLLAQLRTYRTNTIAKADYPEKTGSIELD
jgi:murein DD-endopeptidase MepM/ murein hydrolase activator NlpD